MIYSDEFIYSLKENPIEGTIKLCAIAKENLIPDSRAWHKEDYGVLIQAYALVTELIDANLLPADVQTVSLTGNMDIDCANLSEFFDFLHSECITKQSELKFQTLRSHFRASLATGFCYEFSQGDLKRIQALVNEVRELIAGATDLEKDHKRRLLSRLEKLQSEIHKKVSDLDRFWGLIGDAGVVFGKLGRDAKPIVDRVKEIADIVWQTQSRAEELPSGTKIPMLERKDDADAEA